MKTTILLIIALAAFLNAASQTILRVNLDQEVTGVNIYRSAQAAHDAAEPGDIIVLEPSDLNYGTLILTKPLKVYGNGYFLDVNTNLRADDRSSKLTELYFNTGSDGSEVYGLEIIGDESELAIQGVSNIRIERCLVSWVQIETQNLEETEYYPVSNITFAGNFIEDLDITDPYYEPDWNFKHNISHVLIRNNIFGALGADGGDLYAPEVHDWVVVNNTFLGMGDGSITLANSMFDNNICYLMDPAYGFTFENVSASFNVVSGRAIEGGFNNRNDYPFADTFVASGSRDAKWMIKATSELKSAASHGGEVGAFGGMNPYVTSGIAPIPSMEDITVEGSGSEEIPLAVEITAAAHN